MDYDLSLEIIIVHPEIILIIVQTFDIRVILMSISLGSIAEGTLRERLGVGGIDRCLDSIAVGTLRDRVVVGSILHGRGSANES